MTRWRASARCCRRQRPGLCSRERCRPRTLRPLDGCPCRQASVAPHRQQIRPWPPGKAGIRYRARLRPRAVGVGVQITWAGGLGSSSCRGAPLRSRARWAFVRAEGPPTGLASPGRDPGALMIPPLERGRPGLNAGRKGAGLLPRDRTGEGVGGRPVESADQGLNRVCLRRGCLGNGMRYAADRGHAANATAAAAPCQGPVGPVL